MKQSEKSQLKANREDPLLTRRLSLHFPCYCSSSPQTDRRETEKKALNISKNYCGQSTQRKIRSCLKSRISQTHKNTKIMKIFKTEIF